MTAGLAQKEFFLNQALVVLDALFPRTIIASIPQPPESAGEGDCYRVSSPATRAWSLYADHIAVFTGGAWHFIAPAQGMLVYDQEATRWLCFRSDWIGETAPAAATGGAVIDLEARAMLGQLIGSLERLGLLAPAAP